MQLQVELPHSLVKFHPKLVGIRFLLESNHDVICCRERTIPTCAWASRTRFAATFKSRLFDSASAMSFFSTESVKILCQLWSPIEAPDEELLDTSGAIAAR
jgi:hypothetical protein